jgi:hypothetical protein
LRRWQTLLCRRRFSVRNALLHFGVLAYFLYVYASMALGAAYNGLFLVYVGLFSASFFAVAISFASLPAKALAALGDEGIPRRGPAIYMLTSGLVTLVVWASPVVSALLQGKPPTLLDHYTTLFTYALDLAIVTQTALLSAALILRRAPLGYLLAFPLMGIIILLGPVILAGTLFQQAAGVSFTVGQTMGPIAGFVTLSGLGVWTMGAILRSIADQAAGRPVAAKNVRRTERRAQSLHAWSGTCQVPRPL